MIALDEFVERLCRVAADRGPRGFPRNRRDRAILVKSILFGLDDARSYSEPEINAALLAWKRDAAPAIETDHVSLRRLLVDYGHLERTRDGSVYRVGYPPRAPAFGLEVYEVDVRATVAAYRERSARQRAARRPGGDAAA